MSNENTVKFTIICLLEAQMAVKYRRAALETRRYAAALSEAFDRWATWLETHSEKLEMEFAKSEAPIKFTPLRSPLTDAEDDPEDNTRAWLNAALNFEQKIMEMIGGETDSLKTMREMAFQRYAVAKVLLDNLGVGKWWKYKEEHIHCEMCHSSFLGLPQNCPYCGNEDQAFLTPEAIKMVIDYPQTLIRPKA